MAISVFQAPANYPLESYPSYATEILPDTDRYIRRFQVRSDSNPNKTYTIAFDRATNAGYWVCSCPGATRRGDCKHLRKAGLAGRMQTIFRRIEEKPAQPAEHAPPRTGEGDRLLTRRHFRESARSKWIVLDMRLRSNGTFTINGENGVMGVYRTQGEAEEAITVMGKQYSGYTTTYQDSAKRLIATDPFVSQAVAARKTEEEMLAAVPAGMLESLGEI